MIKIIFFDFDGVLTTDPSGWFTTCKNIHAIVPGIPFDHIVACYKKQRDALNHGAINHKDIWAEFCEGIGTQLDIGLLTGVFRNTPRSESMFELCRQLSKNYTLGIITDNNRERFRLLEKTMKLDQLFPVRILSADVGVMKDDRRIFDRALQAVRCTPAECVFVDNHEHNLVVPRAMGFHTFRHDDEKNDIEFFVQWLRTVGVNV